MPEPEKHENQVSAIKIAGEFTVRFPKTFVPVNTS